ncbi:MAG: hypothetical protein U1A77_03130 [Pirellulales bacterium]
MNVESFPSPSIPLPKQAWGEGSDTSVRDVLVAWPQLFSDDSLAVIG